MGCNWSDTYIPPWENLKFKRFRNQKLNEYFVYLQRTFVTDLLELSSLIDKERQKLLQNLYMDELDLHYEHPYKTEIRDATLALFYAFNTHCDGNMIHQLEMKFFDTMPYVDLNVYKLSDELRNFWKEFCLYVGSLCDRERDLELLDEQYPQIYDDALTICKSQYADVTFDPFSPNVSANPRVNFNIQQLRICRDCIKYTFTQINRDLKGIKDAIIEIRRNPKSMRRVATVCKVDNLTRPWECYTKIARLRNLNIVPHKETEYEKINAQLYKERIQKQKLKYKSFMSEHKKLDNKESRDKEEMDLLYDKIGYNFKKMPSLAMSGQDGDIKNKREMFNSKKQKINAVLQPANPLKLIKYDFNETLSSNDSPKNRKPKLELTPGKDFEDIGIITSPIKSPLQKPKLKQKKKLLHKPKNNKNKSFDIFGPPNNVQTQGQNYKPLMQLPVISQKPIDYAPNAFRDPDLISTPNPSNLGNMGRNLQLPLTPIAVGYDRPFANTPLGLMKRRNSDKLIGNGLLNIGNNRSDLKLDNFNHDDYRFNQNPRKINSDFVSFNF